MTIAKRRSDPKQSSRIVRSVRSKRRASFKRRAVNLSPFVVSDEDGIAFISQLGTYLVDPPRQLIGDICCDDIIGQNLAAVIFHRRMVNQIKMITRHQRTVPSDEAQCRRKTPRCCMLFRKRVGSIDLVMQQEKEGPAG